MNVDRVQQVVRGLFGGSRSSHWRVGAELELLALARHGAAPVPVQEEPGRISLLGMLRQLAAERSWRETRSLYGVPRFIIPGVGWLSFEPGGQLELSTRPFSSPSLLLAALRGSVAILRAHVARFGVDLLELGLDPLHDASTVPLAFPVERYTRMAAYFEEAGGDGARMMKQTASCQISVDVDPTDVDDVWRALNALTPFMIAAFANSPHSRGMASGDASTRARVWQRTDPKRCGIFNAEPDPAAAYRRFVLDAPAFLLDPLSAPLRARLTAVDEDGLQQHLTSLFPEVRPRGYLEFRACDSVGDDARAALLVMLCAVVRDPAARSAIQEITGRPDAGLYAIAPAAPAGLLTAAAEVLALGLAAARRAPRGFWDRGDLSRAERFLQEYTARGGTPASDLRPPLLLIA